MQVYLDNNATTKVDEEVLKEIQPYFSENYFNPSSLYAHEVSKKIEEVRKQVAQLINAHPSEIIFTSGGTEAINLAIKGVIEKDEHIITTKVEHSATLNTCKNFDTTYLNVNKNGDLDLKQLEDSIKINTKLVSVMWANNETGVIFPIDEVIKIVKNINPEILVFTDAVQAVGKIDIDVQKTHVDMLSLSGHKIHAPKGIGALYVRNGIKLKPLISGGHQERGLRGGTENVTGIIALGKACEIANSNNSKIERLRNKLEQEILENCFNAKINGQNRINNTTNISFQYLESELILMELEQCGIYASSGSACLTGSLEPSHVLTAMELDFTQANGAIRFSLSKYTTEKEIDYTIEKISEIISKMIELCPYEDELKKLKE